MKITDVEIIQQAADSKLPGEHAWILVHTDEGITGIGELNRRVNELIAVIGDYTPLLVGRDPRHIERIWETLFQHATPYGNTGAARRAMSAIDMALWDISGKALDAPVHVLLGGTCRDRVPIYSTGGIGGQTRDEVFANMEKMIAAGWKAAKCGPYTTYREVSDPSQTFLFHHVTPKEIARGVEVMGWIKEAAGVEFDVGIDHHPNWDVHGATRVIRAMEPFDLMYFECAMIEDSVEPWAAVAQQCRVPLMCGEYSQSRYQLLPFIERNIVSIVNPDLAWVGGITEIKRIGIIAKTHGVSVAPHDSGPVTTYARCHVMANMSNAFYMELSGSTVGNWTAVTEPLEMTDSSFPVPMKPGLGVELQPDIIEAWRRQVKHS